MARTEMSMMATFEELHVHKSLVFLRHDREGCKKGRLNQIELRFLCYVYLYCALESFSASVNCIDCFSFARQSAIHKALVLIPVFFVTTKSYVEIFEKWHIYKRLVFAFLGQIVTTKSVLS